ncbi:hypothetical protein YC2023_083582 [Brassica napus]
MSRPNFRRGMITPELPSQDTIHLFFPFIFFGLLQGKTKPFTWPSTSFPFSLNLTKTTVDMAKELAAKIKEAFVDDDFDVAVDLYSKAIDLDPNCAEFFADRARPTSNSNTSSVTSSLRN